MILMITFIMILLSVVAQAFPSTFHIGRRPLLMSPIAPLLTANKEEVDYGKSDEGRLKISRREDSLFSIYYRIYNPEGNLTPVVVCHGGPSLPSQYMYPIVPLISRKRPVIFFDQLGCGKSDEPKDLSCYSISQSVVDLETVVSELVSTRGFHLLGHSYGGVLIYELMAKRAMDSKQSSPIIQSMILSNAAFSLGLANTEYDRLWKKNPLPFWNEHACRVGTPPPLEDALKHVGSVWGGMGVVADYVAQPISDQENIPRTLVISGTHDFGYKASNEEAWKPLLPNIASVNLEHCAHYPFYEDGPAYGKILENFFLEHDERK